MMYTRYQENVSELINHLSEEDKLLSIELGVAHNTIWRWRNKVATPSEKNAEALSRLAGITVAELRYGTLVCREIKKLGK